MFKNLTSVLLLVAGLSLDGLAQVTTKFHNTDSITENGAFRKNYGRKVDFEIAAKDIKALIEKEKRKDAETPGIKPYQIAEPVRIDLDIAAGMTWQEVDGFLYGRFDIRVHKALSTSVNFDEFFLPRSTEMYIYNEKGEMITGPVTEAENNEKGIWGSWVYSGERLTVEIKTPAATRNLLVLHSNNIAYGYKRLNRMEEQINDFDASDGQCEINVICPLGTGWENERNSVALILGDDGRSLCSGAIVMNTCGTNRAFLLTANHCYTPPGLPIQNVSAWRFTFQAFSSTCPDPGINTNGTTANGSTLRANWVGSDFALVELSTIPASNSNIRYAGWSRNVTGITQTTIIHHPRGDVMKITRDNEPPTPVTAAFSQGPSQDWKLIIDAGATEKGSSGGPYFDQNHRIIGQHHGTDQSLLAVCNQHNEYGGRFAVSWTGNGTNSTRLSNWLAPINATTLTTNTTNIASLTPVTRNLTMSGSSTICGSSSVYTLTGNSPTANIAWSIQGPFAAGQMLLPLQNVASVPSTGNPVTVSKTANGHIRLVATVTDCDGRVNVVAKDIALGTASIYNNGFYQDKANSSKVITGTTNPTVVTSVPIALVVANNSYTWTKTSGSSNVTYTASGPSAVVTFNSPVNTNNQISFSVATSNACGSRTDPLVIIYQGPNMFSVSPNPATSEINVAPTDETQQLSATTSEVNLGFDRIQIVDKMGIVVQSTTYPANTTNATINISKLRPDMYIVRIFTLNGPEEHKIIVQ
jgi:lysyl endopeptidase